MNTTPQIQAIPTTYRNVQFRSRLEARWAVFYDALSIEWHYEHEGYQLPSGWYLPDFWLPMVGAFRRGAYEPWIEERGLLIEIKPTWQEAKKALPTVAELAQHLGRTAAVFYGDPSQPVDLARGAITTIGRGASGPWQEAMFGWVMCPHCHAVGLSFLGNFLCEGLRCGCDCGSSHYGSLHIDTAYEKARTTRFW